MRKKNEDGGLNYYDFVNTAADELEVVLGDEELDFLRDTLEHLYRDDEDENWLTLDNRIADCENRKILGEENAQEYHRMRAQKLLHDMVSYALHDHEKNYKALMRELKSSGHEITPERAVQYQCILLDHYELNGIRRAFEQWITDIGNAIARKDLPGAISRRNNLYLFVLRPAMDSCGLTMITEEHFENRLAGIQEKVIYTALELASEAKDVSERDEYIRNAIEVSEFDLLEDFGEKREYAWVHQKVQEIKNARA